MAINSFSLLPGTTREGVDWRIWYRFTVFLLRVELYLPRIQIQHSRDLHLNYPTSGVWPAYLTHVWWFFQVSTLFALMSPKTMWKGCGVLCFSNCSEVLFITSNLRFKRRESPHGTLRHSKAPYDVRLFWRSRRRSKQRRSELHVVVKCFITIMSMNPAAQWLMEV